MAQDYEELQIHFEPPRWFDAVIWCWGWTVAVRDMIGFSVDIDGEAKRICKWAAERYTRVRFGSRADSSR